VAQHTTIKLVFLAASYGSRDEKKEAILVSKLIVENAFGNMGRIYLQYKNKITRKELKRHWWSNVITTLGPIN
jgi:hypothetical protein